MSFAADAEAVEDVDGRGACLAAVGAEELGTVPSRFFVSFTTPVALVRAVVLVRALVVLESAGVRAAAVVVVVRGLVVPVAEAGFRRAEVDVVVGLVVDFEGDVVEPLGMMEARRAPDARVDFFFSSSEADGCDLWLIVEAAPEGLFTVDPAGGRAGGLLKELPGRVAEAAVVLEAVETAAPGRRTADVVVVPGRFAVVAVPALVAAAGDLVEALGESVGVSSTLR